MSVQRSERAAALRSIPTELGCSPESVMALTAMLVGLFRNTLSSDTLFLSLSYAERMAKDAGVSDAEWTRVKEIALRAWQRESSKNPMKGMF
jgi:hypothetical protein